MPLICRSLIHRSLIHRSVASLLVGATLALATIPAAQAETVTLRFVQTNDIDRMEDKDGQGGFARLKTVLDRVRAEGPAFFIHAGDTISPSLLSGIDQGRHIIEILNRMPPDVMVPGNHEFDFGADVFRARMAEARFDVVASNVREADGSQPAHTMDHKIVEVDGIRVGFYGLTTETTRVLAKRSPISFASSLDTGRARARALREMGADFVVAVAHTPIDIDMRLVRDGGTDLILSGHDEHLLVFHDGRVALAEAQSQADHVVITRIDIDKTVTGRGAGVTWQPRFEIVNTAGIAPDPEIAALVRSYTDRLGHELSAVIGRTDTRLDTRRAAVRGGEAAFGNLITDAMRAAVGADVALINGGGIRADRIYEPGTAMTRADILAELPFGNRTLKVEVTGAELKAALENGLSGIEDLAGRFPQVSGLTARIDPREAVGMRVLDLAVGGEAVEPTRIYTLATSDYLAAGGDGYAVLTAAEPVINPSDAQLTANQVIDHIAAAGTIAPAVEGRLTVSAP
ncbi:multifunctional 2',3'-cyclic-nucleotide 2'-phosphodiesterase/5'-nucleotidase/3'-nucleotidase [Tistrella bauzanensis]|uniref:Multifunctional 2',3'-cyclic-nucleotide 2'-phosphodiesterase/5'-nucleotidase/3'-nucleotidase n=1 Tax=Tistrella bauzanensis TaxID=657419 RepID=A0ABQ1I790_9PROT|nr:bifunctional UDP-sugar hydrolase/5'-nucleotidase [Tistrella bauzanensis]GGB23779.1 multifunctional 2',3'-cyclic-nucleotide 2'-phosphodiesterase/5'-nucleotidase/3'-nucleotidase [Tistrella bauzanensis]